MLFSCYTLILSSSSRNTYIFSFFLSWAFTFTLAAPFSSLQFLLCHPVYISFPSLISLTYYHSFLAFIMRMPSLNSERASIIKKWIAETSLSGSRPVLAGNAEKKGESRQGMSGRGLERRTYVQILKQFHIFKKNFPKLLP